MRPMLATTGTHVPTEPGWSHEVKWDGVRVLADTTRSGTTRLLSRNENPVTVAWPELNRSPLGDRDLLVDGEVIALNDRGLPDFRVLQDRMHVRNAAAAARLADRLPATYMVFDVMRVDGKDVSDQPLGERRKILRGLGLEHSTWQVPEAYDDGPMLFEATLQQGLEGIVSKRLTSRYVFGERTRNWLKFAHRHRRSYVVGGWRPQEGTTDRLAALLVGESPSTGSSTGAGSAAGSAPRPAGRSRRSSPRSPGRTVPSTTRSRPSTRAARSGSTRCWWSTSRPTASATPGSASRRTAALRTDLTPQDLRSDL